MTMSMAPKASRVASTSRAGVSGSVMSATRVATSAPVDRIADAVASTSGLAAGGHHDPDPFAGQGLGGGPTQAPRAGHHQCGPAVDAQIHPEAS